MTRITVKPTATATSSSFKGPLGPFIDDKGKLALLRYTYSGQDDSLLAAFMYKIWGVFFFLVPSSISPNIVTLTGLAAILSAVAWASLGLSSQPVICYVLAVAVFVYQTADALDGMQGRRVGMYQNPTTEIFDHGVDSCVTVITAVTSIVFVLQLEEVVPALLLLFSGFVGFHAPTYEHVVTRKMIFRGGPTNPTEALLLTQFILIMAGTFPWIFHLGTWGIAALVSLTVGGSALSMFGSVKQLLAHYKGDVAVTLNSALRGYGPLLFVMAAALTWFPFLGEYFVQHNMLAMATVSIPWNYGIMRTIYSEITSDDRVDTEGIIIGQTPLLLPTLCMLLGIPFDISVPLSLLASLFVYLYTVVVGLREVCDALSMEHFWSIRDERLLKKN